MLLLSNQRSRFKNLKGKSLKKSKDWIKEKKERRRRQGRYVSHAFFSEESNICGKLLDRLQRKTGCLCYNTREGQVLSTLNSGFLRALGLKVHKRNFWQISAEISFFLHTVCNYFLQYCSSFSTPVHLSVDLFYRLTPAHQIITTDPDTRRTPNLIRHRPDTLLRCLTELFSFTVLPRSSFKVYA